MRKHIYLLMLLSVASLLTTSCKKDKNPDSVTSEPRLVFRFVFDSTQVRLDSFGDEVTVPTGHGAQSPMFNRMSAHYIEMTPNQWTALGGGEVVYKNEETTVGGSKAIDFSKSNPVGNGEVFYSIPLSEVTPGTYEWLRVSLAYQNYNIRFRYTFSGTNYDLIGTLASFIGYNTYISSFVIKDSTVALNQNRLQGYWAFETQYNLSQGQAPPGATTVPNPIFNSSPIPQGSCVVTGAFETPIVISGNETQDKVVTVSLSTNNSFEWVENSTPGFYEPASGDTVVDMGIRGMRVIY